MLQTDDVRVKKKEKSDSGEALPYLGRVGLQGSQVVLQGQAAPVVQHGLHAGQVSLHQLLLLTGCLLLQRLHHGLEVLHATLESQEQGSGCQPQSTLLAHSRMKLDGSFLSGLLQIH